MTATVEPVPVNLAAFDWTAPTEWTCPACGAVTVTREAEVRCLRCGFREAVT